MQRGSVVGMWVVVVVALAAAPACKSKDKGGQGGAPAAEPSSAPPSPVATAGAPDACALLLADEVKAAVGREVKSSGHGGSGAANVCEYELADGSQVMTSVYTSAGKATFDAAPGEALAGVGDQAKWMADAKMLAVLKGQTSFTVGLLIFDETPAEQVQQQVKTLATAMLGRL